MISTRRLFAFPSDVSFGLGVMQRSLLFRLARHEIGMAERAAELQRPYRSPDR
jgi:hypothetical protein